MPPPSALNGAIRAAVLAIRASGAPAFTSDRSTAEIHPRWLATPRRRYQLWAMLERLEELERDAR
jgi:hypothetical protein